MRRVRDWTAHNVAALAGLVASGLLAAGVAQGEVAARLPDAPPAAFSPTGPAAAEAPRAAGADPARLHRLVLETVSRNLFRPERARPPGRYRPPGASAPAPASGTTSPGVATAPVPQAPPPRPPLPQFRLVGTVALGGGKGLAAIQVSGTSPRVVNVGDSIAGFRLEAVAPTEARLRGADTSLVIRSSSPAP